MLSNGRPAGVTSLVRVKGHEREEEGQTNTGIELVDGHTLVMDTDRQLGERDRQVPRADGINNRIRVWWG